ncbi:hypothetical protein [Rubritalea tangerina]
MTSAHFFQSPIRKQLIKAHYLSAVGVLYVSLKNEPPTHTSCADSVPNLS